MKDGPSGWLVPAAIVGYVALAALEAQTGDARWLLLGWPLGLAFALRLVDAALTSGKIVGPRAASRAVLFGTALYGAAFFGPSDSAGFQAAESLALFAASAGALLFIARAPSPPGLFRGHKAATSLDTIVVSGAVWSITTTASLLRALFPELVLLDPIAFDWALVFSQLGSLLLLVVAELRVLLLRGLELGVADRARAGLALAIAGSIVAVGTAVLDVAPTDRGLGVTLVCATLAISFTQTHPRPAFVTRVVRATLALLLLGAPVALAGAFFAMRLPHHAAFVAFVLAAASTLVGLIARSLAAPLGPEGSRWLDAVESAMDAALHPEPDVAIRETLRALRKVEPTSARRPELYRTDPPARIEVDVAGYLSIHDVEFPAGVLEFASGEPELTLRDETVQKAQVRDARLRNIASWFSAHEAKTATALVDEVGGVGLLVLPRGKRTAHLALEEAEALGRLGRRLAGLLSVNSALARSRQRELARQKEAALSAEEVERLRSELVETRTSHDAEAEVAREVLRVAGHGPRARLCLQEIEKDKDETHLELLTPPGVDPKPWAAHFHLAQSAPRGPFFVFEGTATGARDPAFYRGGTSVTLDGALRAEQGTLLLTHLTALPVEAQAALAEQLASLQVRLVASRAPERPLAPVLARLFDGPSLRLPTLAERSEDLQALVLFELARIGLVRRGEPFGIARAALLELHERAFPGNEEELRGLLWAAAAQAEGDVVTRADLNARLAPESLEIESSPEPPRVRERRPPRSRRL